MQHYTSSYICLHINIYTHMQSSSQYPGGRGLYVRVFLVWYRGGFFFYGKGDV